MAAEITCQTINQIRNMYLHNNKLVEFLFCFAVQILMYTVPSVLDWFRVSVNPIRKVRETFFASH